MNDNKIFSNYGLWSKVEEQMYSNAFLYKKAMSNAFLS